MYYTEDFLIKRVKQINGFKFIPKDYWIIGVRSNADNPDKFDDVFNLMNGEKLIHQTSGTTNPGVKILKNGFLRFNKNGAAIVEADRIYYNIWMYGMHLGRTPALRQRGGEITVWRDGNGNAKSEQIGKRTTGYYGINFHPDQRDINAPDKKGENIGGWSAGCQVCNNIEDYKIFIEKCKDQKNVSYCLLNEFSI